jgi:enterobactin synthetase component D
MIRAQVLARGWATIGVVACDSATEAALHPDELARARGMFELRRRTFVAGRVALRAALASRGLTAEDAIGSDDRGAPVFGRARVSISHKEDVAVGLVVADADAEHVGIDVEDLSELKLDIAPKVLTAAELEVLAQAVRAGARRDTLIRTAFSMKEAIYKAIDPVVRRYVGFREVEVLLGEETRGVVSPRLALARDAEKIDPTRLSVESFPAPHAGAILSVARLR